MYQDEIVIRKKTFHLISLGCPRNLVDSEVMTAYLNQRGWQWCLEIGRADFIIINTCSFLKTARDEGFDFIKSAFERKKKNAKVVVAGCMVQHCKEELLQRFPDIYRFVGSGDTDHILEAIESPINEKKSGARSFLEKDGTPRIISTPSHYSYLKIAEGCLKRCSYCIIPLIKGPLRSKDKAQVLAEFRQLLDKGVFEVILIAQDLGDYGKDRGETGALAELIRELTKEPRPFWLRLLYLYPDEIDADLIAAINCDPRICPYLDMPIQHISDTILRAMRRKTGRSHILKTIHQLRCSIPSIVIRTSLIVGFPQESEQQFQELVDFVQGEELDHVGIFPFSAEKEAIASRMEGQIPEKIKQQRVRILAAAQQSVVSKKLHLQLGRRYAAIVDGVHPDSSLLLTARHSGQCPEIDNLIIINDAPADVKRGGLYQVEVTGSAGYDLVGRII
jgi:ribosomal protein S12 methylthiotransferase